MRWEFVVAGLVLGSTLACGSAPVTRPEGRASSARSPRPADRQPAPASSTAERVVRIARSLVASPYRYSGSDPSGFDCSGLTSYVFAKTGLRLPRTAERQASAGRWVAPDELTKGDLVFFGRDRGKPVHVGVVVSSPGEPLTMIHASSSRGVIETPVLSDSYWLPRLSFGRRVLED